jgi:hypothetical protein
MNRRTRLAALLAAGLLPGAVHAVCTVDGNGTITNPTEPSCRDARFTYTRDVDDATNIALGYDVPLPVDSLTPVDGFRTYASLHARHQALATGPEAEGREVGLTLAGRTIWAYAVGDADRVTTDNLAEPSILINGGIHAREWQSPEAATGFYEWLVENANDAGPGEFIHENLNIVILPVQNVDGLITTQNHPDAVGGIGFQPREGRMRRKNLRHPTTGDTPHDGDLATGEDNFFGVDLNRNGPIGFGANGGSLTDPVSLVNRGTSPDSEPETLALREAARYADESRLRMYADLHSFTRIYLTPMTGNARRDAITERLITRMRAASGFRYQYQAGRTGSRGIGATADWAAYTYQIPSWTLEIEPLNGGQDYGGTGASHSGFILPDDRAAPMREELTRMLFAGAWRQAGPPAVRAVEIRAVDDGQVAYAARWAPTFAGRSLQVTTANALEPGRAYRLWLAFDRPMRWRNDAGGLDNYPGQNVALAPALTLQAPGLQTSADVAVTGTAWLDTPGGAPSGYLAYRDDAVSAEFTAPAAWDTGEPVPLVLSVDTRDFMQAGLDTDPSTPVDWVNGRWTGYEDTAGTAGDVGGTDCSFTPYAGDAAAGAPSPLPCREVAVAPRPASSGGGGSIGLVLPVLAWALARRRRSG